LVGILVGILVNMEDNENNSVNMADNEDRSVTMEDKMGMATMVDTDISSWMLER